MGLKSISPKANKLTSSKANRSIAKGLWAEQVVIRFFQSKGWELLSQRSKIQKIEIDLIFRKENKIAIVEVKHLNDPWKSFDRVHSKQIGRLKQALLRARFANRKNAVNGCIAFVSPNQSLNFISLDEII